MKQTHLENAKVFKAFCDETRLAVLEMLRSGEKCACVLLEQVVVGQSTLSHHMKIFVESGIVSARKEGKWTYYSISGTGCKTAAQLLNDLTAVNATARVGEKERCCK
jgi:ArsR family transcriptional regulator